LIVGGNAAAQRKIRLNFFTDNYDQPIFEGEIQLIDMIYLKKDFKRE